MKPTKAILICNSDFGVGNTIGARALPIAIWLQSKKIKTRIYCRSSRPNLVAKYGIRKVIPFGGILMKFLTAIQIYVSRRIQTNTIKNTLFDLFLRFKLDVFEKERTCLHSWDYTWRTYKKMKRINPESIIIQDVPIAFGNVMEKIKDKKEIIGDINLTTPKYVRHAMDFIDLYVVPSNFVKQSLLKEGVSEEKIEIVPFGVDVNEFKLLRRKNNKRFRVAFSGNVNHRKGVKYLLKAWTALNLPNAELHFYGRIYPEIRQYLVDSEIRGIYMHGFIDLKNELPKNDIFILPTLMEGSAKAVYEALACGLPVITTHNAGSVITDKKEGFIIPVQDIAAIKAKILYFYKNKNAVDRMGKAARRLAERYSWERYAKRIGTIYGDAMK